MTESTRITRTAETFVSAISGREVVVNLDPDRWFVPDSLADYKYLAARERARIRYDAFLNGPPKTRTIPRRPREFIDLVQALWSAASLDAFAQRAGHFVDAIFNGLDNRDRLPSKRYFEVLACLWTEGLIVFPSGMIWPRDDIQWRMPTVDAALHGNSSSLLVALRTALELLPNGASNRTYGLLTRFLQTMRGVTQTCDIDESMMVQIFDTAQDYLMRAAREGRHVALDGTKGRVNDTVLLRTLGEALLHCQQAEAAADPALASRLPATYLHIVPAMARVRSDPEYAWAVAASPRAVGWAADASRYIASIRGSGGTIRYVRDLNHLLDCVVRYESWPASPLSACDSGNPIEPSISAALAGQVEAEKVTRLAQVQTSVGKFFDWILSQYEASPEAVTHHPYRHPIRAHEIVSVPDDERRSQTARTVIPLRYLAIIREILEAPDEAGVPYAWPRSLKEDYFVWTNTQTGERENVWSPVRAYFFLLRLVLPLRTFQVRVLDSGEGDALEYRPGAHGPDDDSAWVANPTPYDFPEGMATDGPRGFARRIYDHELHSFFTGIYVNSNKTKDRISGWNKVGYEIPWHHAPALDLMVALRDFQEKYNPMHRPLRRDECSDIDLRFIAPDVADKIGPVFFLFRDGCTRRRPTQPLSNSRADTFWLRLMAEMEKRLRTHGLTWGAGAPIQIVHRSEVGTPVRSEFDQHSLRVSGITHLLNVAKLPIQVVSAFVAGHATSLMTYYYVKLTPGQISNALEEGRAVLAREDVVAREWAHYIQGKDLEFLRQNVVYNEEDGLVKLASLDPAFLVDMDYGQCPAGGTMCRHGGAAISEKTDRTKLGKHQYLPVLGGDRNCAMCRFFITGPAFLGGLLAKFNETLGRLHDALRRQVDLQRQFREQRALHPDNPYDRGAWDDMRLRRLEESVQKAESDVAIFTQTLERIDELIARTRAVMKDRTHGNGDSSLNAIVLAGTTADFDAALRETTAYDFWNGICQSSEIYPSLEATMPAVRRAKLHDALLTRNGLDTIFLTMEPEECITVGNAFSRWLQLKLSSADVNAVVEGRKTLRDVGLLHEVTTQLTRLRPIALSSTVDLPPGAPTPSVMSGGTSA